MALGQADSRTSPDDSADESEAVLLALRYGCLGPAATLAASNGSSNGWFGRRSHGEVRADMLHTRNPW